MLGSPGLLVPPEAFSETDHVNDHEPQLSVENQSRGVRGAHLQVDLWASKLAQSCLGLDHQLAGPPLSLLRWVHGEVVHPAPVTLVADHDAAEDCAILLQHQQVLPVYRELTVDVLSRIVPGSCQAALTPEREKRLTVLGEVRADHRHVSRCIRAMGQWPLTA